ncbi:transmembrane arabinose efflux transmembrane protein [Herbaspirillum sp. GW103]|uniref:MFS transporter n=2 Tax=unclassified Herbaspirillum TaxID=2624150 RepID=UPI00025E4CA2|nr:transmembrane arabinose efflux transmembrane protein [Herbaspirillum sp. GW103]MCI1005488.1 MFS transporter [Herbaspirillum sp. C7C8]
MVEPTMNTTPTTPTSSTPQAQPHQGSLLTAGFLALGSFAIGTEGFMIAPLLPRMAADFGMSVSTVASLVIVFTLVLAVSSPITTVLSAGINRRNLLIGAMGIFTLANLLAAQSTGFASLLTSRLLMAVAAGLYTPNANALAGAIVKPEQRGRALAIVSGGMTIAIALGLPLGSVVGHAFGWRATFGAVAVMGAVAVAGIWLGVDRRAGGQLHVAGLGERLGVVGQAQIRRLLAITLFWSVGAYAAYPYIAPYLAQTLSFGDQGIGMSVSLWGAAAAVGVTVGGSLNDRFGSGRVVRLSLLLLMLAFWALSAATLLAPQAALVPVLAAVVVWGFAVWAFFPAQMARLIAAGPPAQASVALSLNTSTMYLGFSLGSAVGAGILALGWVGGIGLFAGACALAGVLLERRMKAP